MANDFFEKKEEAEAEVKVEGQEQEPQEKIKVGEEEFSQVELDELVNLGKIGKEAQEKWDTPIDKVYPEFTKKSQLLKELEEKEQARQATKEAEDKAALDKKTEAGDELSPEEQQTQLNDQIDKVILNNPAFAKKVGEIFSQQRSGEELLNKCNGLEGEIDGKDGRPTFKTKEVLDHMAETGIKNPQDAYDLKFKDELNKWRDDKLGQAKPEGMVTEGGSPAGNKQPPEVKITKQNLDQSIRDSLYGKG